MKRCPTCSKTFTDENLSFCVDDGTPLAQADPEVDETTRVSSYGQSGSERSSGSGGAAPPYQPPGTYIPPDFSDGPQTKRRSWPWVLVVLGIVLLAFAALGIAGAIFVPAMLREHNESTANSNANVYRNNNSNANLNNSNVNGANWNQNGNSDYEGDESKPPPTDEAKVLADLTDLEQDWTVANINADKKKLDQILADDYVGMTFDGNSQGKAEYLQNIQRDTATQKWDFESLRATLKGDRATLTGIIRLKILNQAGEVQDVAYNFTDKFVWRDGRWQATGSEVSLIK